LSSNSELLRGFSNDQLGESVFITNDSKVYQYQGDGMLARAYNEQRLR
jgi:hypothetical protein